MIDQAVINYYDKILLERCCFPLAWIFCGNYQGRWFKRKICWLLKHKWVDITDKSVETAKRCSRCLARIIERKPYNKIMFRRYNS